MSASLIGSHHPKGTIKYCQTVPKSALDRDRDTVEACRLVLGMRCRPGYKNVYLVERFDEGSTSRSNRPPGPSAGIYRIIAPVSVGALRHRLLCGYLATARSQVRPRSELSASRA